MDIQDHHPGVDANASRSAARARRALNRVAEIFAEATDPQLAFQWALREAARLIPGAALALHRVHASTGETEQFVCHGITGFCARSSVHRLLGRDLYSRQPAISETEERDPARISLSPEVVLMEAGLRASRADVYLSGVSDSCLDLLLVTSPAEGCLSEISEDFICAFLGSLPSVASPPFNRRREMRLHFKVQRAKQEWEAIIDALPQLVCLLDRNGAILRANRALEDLHLGDVRTIAGCGFSALLSRLGLMLRVQSALSGAPDDGGSGADLVVARAQSMDGLWAQLKAALLGRAVVLSGLMSESGRIYDLKLQTVELLPDWDAEPGCYIAIFEDATERTRARRLIEGFNEELERTVVAKTAELMSANERLTIETEARRRDQEALRDSEARWQSFVEHTRTGIYLTEDGRVTYHNSRFANMLGYGAGELVGARLADLLGGELSAKLASATGLDWDEGACEGLVRRCDGRFIWLHITQAPHRACRREAVIGNTLDITARKEFEQRLLDSKRQTSQLSERLLVAQEQERRRIARELHDGVGQQLNAARLMLEHLVEKCKAGERSFCLGKAPNIVSSLRDAVEETRRVSMALRPSMLDDLGIGATLSWFLREMSKTMPEMTILQRVDLDETAIGARLKTEVFRITQEAFNNICKHAHASRVELCAQMMPGEVALSIRDNGRGIVGDVEKLHRGVGMNSMRERAELTGGILSIVSRDGGGVSVICRWPLSGG